MSAIQHCRSGHDGSSLSQCQHCGGQHRVQHACGNRPCPQCQQHTTQQWLHHHLDTQLPGPHFLLTFTVPETLRPFIRGWLPLTRQGLAPCKRRQAFLARQRSTLSGGGRTARTADRAEELQRAAVPPSAAAGGSAGLLSRRRCYLQSGRNMTPFSSSAGSPA
jgi:hypothetical protein